MSINEAIARCTFTVMHTELHLKTRLHEAVQRVIETFGSVTSPRPEDRSLDELHSRIWQAVEQGNFAGIQLRDWKMLPWVLWWNNPILAERNDLWKEYRGFLNGCRISSPLKMLIHVYLRDFPCSKPGLDQAACTLREYLQKPDLPPLLRIWAERHQRYHLFDPEQGPRVLMHTCLDADDTAQALDKAGLVGELANGRFVRRSYELALEEIQSQLAQRSCQQDTLNRFFRLSENEGQLRFPELRAQVADTLLRPFAEINPTDEQKELIEKFLLRHLRDPRLHGGNWLGVSDASRSVILCWLAGASIEQFFEVINKHALDRHWRYRHAFWGAYYNRGHIMEAWVAFGPNPQEEARHAFGNDYAAAHLYGGVDPNHSVLLLRIGDLTIAEWSHNGKCRIWLRSDQRAPALYQQHYNGYSLRRDAEQEFIHFGSENGTWQARVASFIRNRTGININYEDYMP